MVYRYSISSRVIGSGTECPGVLRLPGGAVRFKMKLLPVLRCCNATNRYETGRHHSDEVRLARFVVLGGDAT
jgi:hypothetical protein